MSQVVGGRVLLPETAVVPEANQPVAAPEAWQVSDLVAACGLLASGGGGVRCATVLLGHGAPESLLAPERLASLEARFHVYLEVLDRGSAVTQASVRITRPPAAGPLATRCAALAGRLLERFAQRRRGASR